MNDFRSMTKYSEKKSEYPIKTHMKELSKPENDPVNERRRVTKANRTRGSAKTENQNLKPKL
jgi:hypothetical protein